MLTASQAEKRGLRNSSPGLCASMHSMHQAQKRGGSEPSRAEKASNASFEIESELTGACLQDNPGAIDRMR